MKWTAKRVLSWLSGLFFVGVILFYAYYQSRAILEGPQISLVSPSEGMTSTSSLIKVYGVAKHAKELTLDGRPIFLDLNGNFFEQLLLMDGYNIMELTAKDAEGREIRKTVRVMYKPAITTSPTATSSSDMMGQETKITI
jgi:hypothetical protein